ncbi:MAG: hypothetical protein A2937_03130 [Candidatus Yonathbacteria bacterium RIFCSPLOWO2_01_FULL_47_33b]|uniref:Uncharacterized protein n=1 Tax=Candidatus Yonathbacteria bacterium RIFCSPLOWO2_01_FULL_47_33b TaxID=1802727 RepID=A0A1G2SD94_9BACT|nr:MAG: hypothetical protein A2937_03130 [Candidatus Yonathbacteria bacterium RIFCSPLOWO2_01_FULL_47_33b]
MNLLQKMFGRIDVVVSIFFRLCHSYHTPGTNGVEKEGHFYADFGKRFGLLDKDEVLVCVGGWHQIVHHYDKNGHLLKRQLRRKLLKPGEKMLTGKELEPYLIARGEELQRLSLLGDM